MMKSPNSWPCRRPKAALLTTLLLAACATDDAADRVNASAAIEADASLAVDAARRAAQIPDLPADCRRHERTGVRVGDRLDVAALKGDQAVGRGNARIDRCSAWYDSLRAGRGGPTP